MWKFIVKHLAIFIFVIIAATALTFYVMHSLPGENVKVIAQYIIYGNVEIAPSNDEVNFITTKFNLDEPLYVQYISWLDGVIHGDMGYSYKSNQAVYSLIIDKLPATMLLSLVCVLVSILIGIPLGVIAALRHNTLIDYFCSAGAVIGKSIPSFWLAIMLIWIFSLKLDLTPVAGYGDIQHMILPVVTLGTSAAAVIARLTRSSMLEIMGQDYIRTAKGKGLSRNLIVYRHAFKNAMLPLITVIGLQVGGMLGGSVIVESIFAWPGIGKLMMDSINSRDIPVIEGCVFIFIITYMLVNFVVDLSYKYFDPRIGRDDK
jgi:peptide/nickel transport system permease protein